MAAVCCIIAIVARRPPIAFPLALALAAVTAGFAVATLKTVQIAHPILARPAGNVAIAGFVEVREERERTDRIVVRALSFEGTRLEQKLERIRVSVKKGTAPPVGAYVTFRARLSPPLEPLRPGGYDFARDLYFQGIGATGFAPASKSSARGVASRGAAPVGATAVSSGTTGPRAQGRSSPGGRAALISKPSPVQRSASAPWSRESLRSTMSALHSPGSSRD